MQLIASGLHCQSTRGSVDLPSLFHFYYSNIYVSISTRFLYKHIGGIPDEIIVEK